MSFSTKYKSIVISFFFLLAFMMTLQGTAYAYYGGGGLYGSSMYGGGLYGSSMYGGGLYGSSMYGGGLYGSSMYGGGLYGSNMYGGGLYGSSMYGGGLYGSSMYGGGLYGSSMYGGLYGSSMYGGLYGSSMYGGGLYGSSMYGGLYGSSMYGGLYGSSMYGGLYGSSMYGGMYGSSMYGGLYGSSMYGGLYGSSLGGLRYGLAEQTGTWNGIWSSGLASGVITINLVEDPVIPTLLAGYVQLVGNAIAPGLIAVTGQRLNSQVILDGKYTGASGTPIDLQIVGTIISATEGNGNYTLIKTNSILETGSFSVTLAQAIL